MTRPERVGGEGMYVLELVYMTSPSNGAGL
jgi:hypothetical protein